MWIITFFDNLLKCVTSFLLKSKKRCEYENGFTIKVDVEVKVQGESCPTFWSKKPTSFWDDEWIFK